MMINIEKILADKEVNILLDEMAMLLKNSYEEWFFAFREHLLENFKILEGYPEGYPIELAKGFILAACILELHTHIGIAKCAKYVSKKTATHLYEILSTKTIAEMKESLKNEKKQRTKDV